MNFYDSGKISDLLNVHGYKQINNITEADLVVLNTCHIREKASEKLFSDLGRIKKLKKTKPLKIAVTGCVAQAESKEIISRAPYVDLVLGPQSYHRFPEMLRKIEDGYPTISMTEFLTSEKFDNLPDTKYVNGPSAFISIQEGCDKFCTFCVVPYTRGSEYSRSFAEIMSEVNILTQKGVKEITLLGQNVNAWHSSNTKNIDLGIGDLIIELAKNEKLSRIRYTTSHPLDMDQKLIEAHRDVSKLMPYLHLPIQSGSNKILNLMNRKHSRSDYIKIIDKIRKYCPQIAISGDFIVGFPGETEKDFNDTLSLVEEINYSQAYSFKYSPRPGTPASIIEDIVSEDVKNERLYRLQELLNKQKLEFNLKFLNKYVEVLIEKKGKLENQNMGRSPWMQTVYVNSQKCNIGDIKKVKIDYSGLNSLRSSDFN